MTDICLKCLCRDVCGYRRQRKEMVEQFTSLCNDLVYGADYMVDYEHNAAIMRFPKCDRIVKEPK